MADDAGARGIGLESGWRVVVRNLNRVDEEEDGRGGEADGGEADGAGPEAAPIGGRKSFAHREVEGRRRGVIIGELRC